MTPFVRKHQERLALAFICIVFGAMGFLRLNDLSLYTDSTRYVIWGTSIAHGKGFVDDTQPDAESYVVNAPLYAVVLAPVMLFFPYSLTAAKIWTLLWGIGSLVLFHIWLRRRFNSAAALVGVVVFAFNPLMLVLATEAMSETVFIAALILIMILYESWIPREAMSSRRSIAILILLSFLPLLREVAVALTGAIAITGLRCGERKRIAWMLAGTALIGGVWAIRNLALVGTPSTSQGTNVSFMLGHFVTAPDASPLSEFVMRLSANVGAFYIYIASLLLYPFPQSLIFDPSTPFKLLYKSMSFAKYMIPFVSLPLVIHGMARDYRQHGKRLMGILFLILYLLVIFLYPVQDVRFLLPLLPLCIFYCLSSWQSIAKGSLIQSKGVLAAAIVATIAILPNLLCDYEVLRTNRRYRNSPADLYADITNAGSNKEMFVGSWSLLSAWIEANLPDEAVIAAAQKDLSLFVGKRKLLEVNYGVSTETFERMLRDYGVDYVLSTNERERFRPYEFAMMETSRFWFEPVSVLGGLVLYKVHNTFIDPVKVEHVLSASDTTTGRGLLRRGRTELLCMNYEEAIRDLKLARDLGADVSLSTFQLTVAYAMSGQEETAEKTLKTLYSLPRTTSYISPARMHLQTMKSLATAYAATGIQHQSVHLFDIATFYWNFGYKQRSYALVKEILKRDTAYFVGLLWGWNYATEMGDRLQARSYLEILKNLEPDNSVVQAFSTVTALNDTLGRTTNARERSRLRVAAADTYASAGLAVEAFDNAEKAIGEDPTNMEAVRCLTLLFEQQNKPWGVKKARRMLAKADL